jgi:hypothetical protein
MSRPPFILTVDRNQRNLELLGQFLGKEGYSTLPVSTLEDFERILDQSHILGLALRPEPHIRVGSRRYLGI